MKINITAIVKSKIDSIEEVKSHLIEMATNSKNEDACLQYDLHQDKENPTYFFFHEIWESEEALALHNEQPYIKKFVARAAEILAEPVLVYKTNKIA